MKQTVLSAVCITFQIGVVYFRNKKKLTTIYWKKSIVVPRLECKRRDFPLNPKKKSNLKRAWPALKIKKLKMPIDFQYCNNWTDFRTNSIGIIVSLIAAVIDASLNWNIWRWRLLSECKTHERPKIVRVCLCDWNLALLKWFTVALSALRYGWHFKLTMPIVCA